MGRHQVGGDKVLVLGCGPGREAVGLAERGCKVTGLDLLELNIEQAESRAHDRGLAALADFQLGDATEMPFPDGSFDVVMGQDAWCHVPDKDELIRECARVLRPGGAIVFSDWLQVGAMEADIEAEMLSATASVNAFPSTLTHASRCGLGPWPCRPGSAPGTTGGRPA